MSAYSWGVEIYGRSDAMTLRSDEIRWWNTHKDSSILLITSAITFTSSSTNVAINWQKNIIQHPYWGKTFPFWDDYACI